MPALSNATKLAIANTFGIAKETDAGTLVAPSIAFAVEKLSMKNGFNREAAVGLFGSMVRPKQLDVRTTTTPSGAFTVLANNANLALLLELATGDASSPMTPGATLGTFSAVLELAGVKQQQHGGCKIDTLTLEASQSDQLLKATIEYLAMNAAFAASGNLAIPAFLVAQAPYLFGGCALTIGGNTFNASRLRLALKNNLLGDHLQNSITRLKIPEGERTVEGELEVDFNADTWTNFVDAVEDLTFAALVATFAAAGGYSLAFTLPAITFPEETIGLDVGKPMSVTVPFVGRATTVGGTDLFSIALTNPA